MSMPNDPVTVEQILPSLTYEAKQPSINNILSAVHKSRQHKNLAGARWVYQYVQDHQFETNSALGNHLVPMFVECGSISDAQEIFDKLGERSEHSWTSLIQGYIREGDLQHAFKIYHEMQDDCVYPSKFTFVTLLKAVTHRKSIDRGRELHSEVVKEAFESNIFVANRLIDMYAKCGYLVEAQEVFDMLPTRDIVSWNTLIAAYTEHGLDEEVWKYFNKMKVDGVVQDAVTFVCGLKACSMRKLVDKGLEIHSETVLGAFDDILIVRNSLINMYSKCGLIAEAKDMFDDLDVRDIVSWNTLMTAYAEHGLLEQVLNLTKQMENEGISLDSVTFLCSLRACSSMHSLMSGQHVHAEVITEGLEEELSVANALMNMYVKCGSFADAKDIFDQLPVRDVVSWSLLFTGYAEHGLAWEAFACFKQMKAEGVPANATVYLSILKCFSSRGSLDKGREIHSDIVKQGFEIDPFIGNSVVDMYAKCLSLGEAIALFDRLQSFDVVIWNTIMAAYIEHGLGKEAWDCFVKMVSTGILPDTLSFTCALKSCTILGELAIGQDIHAELVKQELENEMLICNILVDLYARMGWLVEAQDVFDHLAERNVVTWTALLSGYAEHGLGNEVLHCLEKMQLEGVYPDAVALVSSLKGCGIVGALERGREIHATAARAGFELVCSSTECVCSHSIPSTVNDTVLNLVNALIDMYAKCGSMTDAQKVFDSSSIVDIVAWNALIAGYARQEESKLVTYLVRGMREKGLEPNELTFLNLLSVCSHLGRLDKGQEYFEILLKEHYAALNIGHFNCLIDLFGRAGRVDEAAAVLEQVPLQLDLVSWGILLDGCRKEGNMDLSRTAFTNAINLVAERKSTFILLSDIYAGTSYVEMLVAERGFQPS